LKGQLRRIVLLSVGFWRRHSTMHIVKARATRGDPAAIRQRMRIVGTFRHAPEMTKSRKACKPKYSFKKTLALPAGLTLISPPCRKHMSHSITDVPTSSGLGKHTGSFDLYSEITRQITDMLDKGVVPWRSPILGRSKGGYPKNLDSKKQYRGVNVFRPTQSDCCCRNTPALHWRFATCDNTWGCAASAGGMVATASKAARRSWRIVMFVPFFSPARRH
jgi:hypothetical protein